MTNFVVTVNGKKPVAEMHTSIAVLKPQIENSIMKRGWTGEWTMPKRNSEWVFTAKNSNGKVTKVEVSRGGLEADNGSAPQKPSKAPRKAAQRKTASQGRKRHNKALAAKRKTPVPANRPGTRPKVAAKGNEDHRKIVVGKGQTVEMTVHPGGTVIINYK